MEDRMSLRAFALIAVASVSSLTLSGCTETFSQSFIWYDKGVKLYKANELDDAAGAFRRATKQNPRNYQAFFMLGEVYALQGRNGEALRAYSAALDVLPTTREGRLDHAFRQQIIDRYAQYIASIPSRDIEIASLETRAAERNTATDWLLLARTLVASGDADGAIDAYNKALLAGLDDISVRRSFGLYLASLGQTRRASPYLRDAYTENPRDTEVIEALRAAGIAVNDAPLASPARDATVGLEPR
jgi:cytochrome c-type biogenesis protein CcmH/NrfG